jgi:hypothetical protein
MNGNLPNILNSETPRPEGRGSLQGNPRDHRHGQLSGREEGGDEDCLTG